MPRERSDIKVDGVWDIETEGWNTFVCGGLYCADGTYREWTWRDEEVYARHLLDGEGHYWAHNAGRFDDKWLLDWAVRLGREVAIASAGSRIILMRTGNSVFYDSKALVPISLKEFTSDGDYKKSETGLPCACGRACGGYCAITRNMEPRLLKTLMEYCYMDHKSLFEALMKLKRFAETNDLDLAPTVGAAAWKNMKRTLDLPDADRDRERHEFARPAYYGGRVQVLRPFSSQGVETDVNAMYPSRLAYFKIPCGKGALLRRRNASSAYSESTPGIYKANVTVPETHLPPIPYRTKKRIAYPFGKISGTWTLPELEYSESLGARVDIQEALAFRHETVVFREWVDKLFTLRRKLPEWTDDRGDRRDGKDSPLGTWIKFYCNSPTGKFGSRPDHEKIIVNPSEIIGCKGQALEDGSPGPCVDGCVGWCGAMRPIGPTGCVYSIPEWKISGAGHIEWAAYLTSYARIAWHQRATKIDDGLHVVYGDTDSIFTERLGDMACGNMLGEWQNKGEYRDFKCYAPKVYTFTRDSKLKVKAKGIRLPRDTKEARAILESGQVSTNEVIIGFKSGISHGKFFEKDEIKRTVGVGHGDRWFDARAGVTRPPMVDNRGNLSHAHYMSKVQSTDNDIFRHENK